MTQVGDDIEMISYLNKDEPAQMIRDDVRDR